MTEATPRLSLPLLVPGQAQKEMFHNEALALLDLAVQASVVAVGQDAPPAAPAIGAAWIVGDAPVGDWAGQAGAIAGWTPGGWRFVSPRDGMVVWDQASGEPARRAGGTWSVGILDAARLRVAGIPVVGAQQAAIAAPAGGSVTDMEARACLNAILAALRAHGLVAA